MSDLILLVEDDDLYGKVVTDFLEENELTVVWLKEGTNVISEFKKITPRLVILDVELPGKDGFQVALEIRKINGVVPIIFMTGTAFEKESYDNAYRLLGAVNYIEKPVNPHNLVAQIKGLLHPVSHLIEYHYNNHHFVIDGTLLMMDNVSIQFTSNEMKTVSLLFANINHIVKRTDIMLKIWGTDDVNVNSALDSILASIRRKLKKYPCCILIQTIYSEGYKLKILP